MRTLSILSILSLVFISIIFSISQQNAHVDARLIIKRLSYRYDDSEIFIKKRNLADRFNNKLQARAKDPKDSKDPKDTEDPKDPKDTNDPKDPEPSTTDDTPSSTDKPSSDSSTSEINIDVATSLEIAGITSTPSKPSKDTSSATSATTTSTTSKTSSKTSSVTTTRATTNASSNTPSVTTTNTSSSIEQNKNLNGATTTSAATTYTNSASSQSVPTGSLSTTGIALIAAVCSLIVIFIGALTCIRKKKRRQMTDTIVATSSSAWEQQNNTYEKLEEETNYTSPPQPKPIGSYTVIATYTPTLPDELDIQPGDKVAILVEYDDGWVQGVNETRGGTKGVFPRHCVDMNIALNNKRSSSMGTYSVVDLN